MACVALVHVILSLNVIEVQPQHYNYQLCYLEDYLLWIKFGGFVGLFFVKKSEIKYDIRHI